MKTQIREYGPEDGAALVALWHRVFEDPEALSVCLLRILPELGGAVVAEADGVIAGAACVITGLRVGDRRAAYVYAVAVLPEYRGLGLGKALTKAAAALGKKLGADFVCTLPASLPLYGWYEELIGVRFALYRRKERFPVRPGPDVRELSAEEYNERREALLAPLPHLTLSAPAMHYQQLFCRELGGGLYAVGDGIAVVYREESRGLVWELLCPDPAMRRVYAAAAAAFVGAEQTVLFSPSGKDGEPYIAAEPGFLPEGCIWDLAFD